MASGNQGKQGPGDTSNRGFASMDPNKQREIASQGGKAAHEKGTAHEFTSEEARQAGREGGKASGGGSRDAGNQGSSGNASGNRDAGNQGSGGNASGNRDAGNQSSGGNRDGGGSRSK